MHRYIKRLCYWLAFTSGAALVGVTLLMVIDVIGRYVFNSPLTFAVETIELLMGLSIAFGLALTTYNRGHIRVDLLTQVVSPRLRKVLDLLADLTSIVFFALIAWKTLDKAGQSLRDGLYTQILGLPVYPVVYLMSAGATVAALAAAVHFFRAPAGQEEG
ncbi:TRAP transporter small permease [Roseibium sp. Sym1]|uniref:TRAP transporter small permease n=1 Tax=Roseibium sp. Sym1 TaxID=3016006 RepID=UPI0022B59F0B|nr:TRAP transporter small permease [Roseibium sp. Sym1]